MECELFLSAFCYPPSESLDLKKKLPHYTVKSLCSDKPEIVVTLQSLSYLECVKSVVRTAEHGALGLWNGYKLVKFVYAPTINLFKCL